MKPDSKMRLKIKIAASKALINKETYLGKKEFQKMLRMITRKIVNCETSIEKLESELEQLSKQIESQGQEGISYRTVGGHSIFERYGMRKKELDDNLSQWEKLAYRTRRAYEKPGRVKEV